MPSSHFSKIVVLQSLPLGEMPTGKRLFEDIETRNVFFQRGLKISFNDVLNKPQFLVCLEQLREEAARGTWPLLHIECHGANDKTGIVLADSSFLSWVELKPYLTAINVETRCNLIIVLGSCYGGHLGEIIYLTDRVPCWALIGPTHEVFPNELISNFSDFYTELLRSLDGNNSLKALQSTPLKTGGYFFTTAIGFFQLAYANYLF